MHELRNGMRREIFARLHLDLSTGLSDPWRQRGIAVRQSFDLVATSGLIILNHRQNKVTTAQEVERVLGIPRSTAQRQCKLMAREGYLTINGSGCRISDQFAAIPLLSSENFAEIEAAIHRASDLLRTLNDEDTDETAV
jgi:hypothetical protein